MATYFGEVTSSVFFWFISHWHFGIRMMRNSWCLYNKKKCVPFLVFSFCTIQIGGFCFIFPWWEHFSFHKRLFWGQVSLWARSVQCFLLLASAKTSFPSEILVSTVHLVIISCTRRHFCKLFWPWKHRNVESLCHREISCFFYMHFMHRTGLLFVKFSGHICVFYVDGYS